MAFAGLKKQINKANQYVTEKMGGAEGTKLDYDFMEMERKTDVTVELVEELQTKTKEYLQPNPTARARMQAVKEGTLAECMLTYGKKLGDDSIFAQSLVEMGDSLKQMADVKYALDDRVKQNFLEPLHSLQTKDLKEVMHHRKKLQGRRLDFDCKRRRQAKAGSNITDDEIRGAEEKFAESWQLAQMGMYNLLENDVEQVSQLCVFAEAMYEYHEQCTELLKVLVEVLNQKREEAADRPKSDFQPKTLADLNVDSGSTHGSDGVNGSSNLNSPVNKPTHLDIIGNGQAQARSTNASPLPSPMRSPAKTPNPQVGPCCTALYDFEPENPGELGFKENDVIQLINKVDENWYEGSVRGRTGYFPQSYVTVTVPLP